MIAKLLRTAFEYRIVFTVGASVTTGKQNTTVWNDIHHKTSMQSGLFGYSDETYLDRVEELRASQPVDAALVEKDLFH